MGEFNDIDKFSLEQILLCIRDSEVVRDCQVQFFKIDVGDALLRVGESFAGLFHFLFGLHSLEGFDPVQFAKKSLMICLKMSKGHDPLHAVLACAFLTEYVSHFARDRSCFLVTVMAYKCMRIVMNRWLNHERWSIPVAWHEFITCVRDLNERVHARLSNQMLIDVICHTTDNKARTERMVKRCSDLDQIRLTPQEKDFLIATIDITDEDRELIAGQSRRCEFCYQDCAIFVGYCARIFKTPPPFYITLS